MRRIDAEVCEQPLLVLAKAAKLDALARGEQGAGDHSHGTTDEVAGLREVDHHLGERLALQPARQLRGAGSVKLAGYPVEGGVVLHLSLQAACRHGTSGSSAHLWRNRQCPGMRRECGKRASAFRQPSTRSNWWQPARERDSAGKFRLRGRVAPGRAEASAG